MGGCVVTQVGKGQLLRRFIKQSQMGSGHGAVDGGHGLLHLSAVHFAAPLTCPVTYVMSALKAARCCSGPMPPDTLAQVRPRKEKTLPILPGC